MSTGIRVSDDATIQRISKMVSFSYLVPKEKYETNIHIPLVMLLGEHHVYDLSKSQTDRERAGFCQDCQYPECVVPDREDMYQLLSDALGTEEHPVDIYSEAWRRFAPASDEKDPRYLGVLADVFEVSGKVGKETGKVRSHSNDPRGALGGLYGLNRPDPDGDKTILYNLIEEDGTIDYDKVADKIVRIEMHDKLTRLPLQKQILAQDPLMMAVDGRRMTDLSVWKDVIKISLKNYIEGFGRIIRRLDLGKIKAVLESNDWDDEVAEMYDILNYSFNLCFLDTYQLARMFKKQCVGKSGKTRVTRSQTRVGKESKESICQEKYGSLAVIVTGAAHSRNMASLLTNPKSPVSFYNTVSTFSLSEKEEKRYFKKGNVLSTNMDGEPAYCLDFVRRGISIDLAKDVEEWRVNHAWRGPRISRSLSRSRSSRSTSRSRSGSNDTYLSKAYLAQGDPSLWDWIRSAPSNLYFGRNVGRVGKSGKKPGKK
jgi:hypothetical protein